MCSSDLALAHTMTGELGEAAALVAEAQAIDRATGVPSLVYADAALVAWRGERKRSLSLLEAGRRAATSRGEGRTLSVLEYSDAVLQNGLGHYDARPRHAHVDGGRRFRGPSRQGTACHRSASTRAHAGPG